VKFINPSAKVFRHLDRVVAWQQGQKAAPVTVEWDLSNRCVLGCQDCHFAHTHVRGPWASKARTLPMAFDSTGDMANLNVVARGLQEMARAGVQGVVWSGGGEPTTHPEWLSALTLASLARLKQGMYTLGGLITKDEATVAAKLLDWVVVSLDAVDAETYAKEKGVPPLRFKNALGGVQMLAAGQTTVGVSFLLHGANWLVLDRMLELSRSLGAAYTTFRPAIQVSQAMPDVCTEDRSWITEALPKLVELSEEPDVEVDPYRFVQYRDWNGHGYTACQGVKFNTTITPDGRVWLCPQRRGVGDSIGNLNDESFGDIWARHPGNFSVDRGCRVMCRLHPVNQTLDSLTKAQVHSEFV